MISITLMRYFLFSNSIIWYEAETLIALVVVSRHGHRYPIKKSPLILSPSNLSGNGLR